MDTLRCYLNSLSVTEQNAFASRCGTSIGYLRSALASRTRLGPEISARIEIESKGEVPRESVSPGTDWALLRSRSPNSKTEAA